MEYGEPWSNKNGFIENRDGVDIDGTRQSDTRAVACVNSLSGIPDSWLADRAAAKALLYCSMHVPKERIDAVIKSCVAMRSRGADFGELNQLIDSFKEE